MMRDQSLNNGPISRSQSSRGSMRIVVAVAALFGALGFFLDDIFTSNGSRFNTGVQQLCASTGTATVGEARDNHEFETTWPKVKNKLCPDMIPATKLGYKLIDLARKEAGLKQFNETDQDPSSEKLFRRFFEVHQGGFLYISPDKQPTLYTDIWKCAHDQIRGWATKTLKRLDGEFTEISEMRLPGNLSTTLKSLKQRHLLDQTCIVTAIRDPVSHFLSGYNEIEFRSIREPQRLREAPGLLYSRYEEGSTQRFEQFVTDFLTGPGKGSWKAVFKAEQLDHVYSLSAVLHGLALEGAKMTSYLSSLKNLQETWPKYIQSTCPGISDSVVEPMELVRQHESKKDEHGFYEASKRVWADGGPTARAICSLHAIDYACWDDLPEGVPVVCQDLYSSPHFIDALAS